MIRSIFSRLLLSHIIIILLTAITYGAFMSYLIRGHVVENKRRELLAKGSAIATVISPTLNNGHVPFRLELLGDLVGTNIWLVNQQGKVLSGDPPPRWALNVPGNSTQLEALFAGTPQSWVRNARNQPDPAIIVALPLSSVTTPTALFLYAPITGINQTIQALDRLLLISLLVGMLAAIVLGYFIARGLTRPIASISRAAVRFAGGDYSSRTDAVGGGEIGQLGQVFNSMAESLAHTEQNRRDFLANVSHELKTPVASIQALAETLHDGLVDNPTQQERYLTTIVEESKRIDRLLLDLLDLAQLEAGELTIIPEEVALHSFLSTEFAKYDHFLAAKNLKLVPSILPDLPPVLADPGRLSQVISNFLSNAIRYSPENASISVAVYAASKFVSIAISDSGPGIPPADQPYIWDRFYRVDKSRSRSGGGTGLGLAIAKRLVQAMGGIVTVSSVPGERTTFTFTLPIAK